MEIKVKPHVGEDIKDAINYASKAADATGIPVIIDASGFAQEVIIPVFPGSNPVVIYFEFIIKPQYEKLQNQDDTRTR